LTGVAIAGQLPCIDQDRDRNRGNDARAAVFFRL